jgi:WD40 repeat protein
MDRRLIRKFVLPFAVSLVLLFLVWWFYQPRPHRFPIVDYVPIQPYPLAISGNGELIVAIHEKNIYLFDPPENEPVKKIPIGEYVFSTSLSLDGSYLACGTKRRVRLYDLKDNAFFDLGLEGLPFPSWYYRVSLSPDGNYLAVGTESSVHVFRRDTRNQVWAYSPGPEIVSVSISTEARSLAVLWGGGLYFLRDGDNDLAWFVLGTAWDFSPSVSVSPDGRYVAVSGFLYTGKGPLPTLHVFGENDNTLLWSHPIERVVSVSLSADGGYLAVGTDEGRVYLFDWKENQLLWRRPVGDDVVVSISADGNRVAAASTSTLQYHATGVKLFENGVPIWSYSFEERSSGLA